MTKDLEFKIDAWTPETLPQERLGQYLVEISKLYGDVAGVRFHRLRKGSAVVVSRITETGRPKVERRLLSIRHNVAPKDAVESYRRLDDMLATDNSTGVIRGLEGGAVVPFPGRNRDNPVEYGAVREEGILEGEIVRIGGRDASVHLTLQDGDTVYSSIETTRDLARQLGRLIFGPIVRLSGTGSWRRTSQGVWTLDRFIVSGFVILDNEGLAEALDGIRALGASAWHEEADPIATLLSDRHGRGSGTREGRKS